MRAVAAARATRVGKYEVGEVIDEGTFCKVKFAKNLENGKQVAAKVMLKVEVGISPALCSVLMFAYRFSCIDPLPLFISEPFHCSYLHVYNHPTQIERENISCIDPLPLFTSEPLHCSYLHVYNNPTQIERENMSQNIKREIQIMKMLTHDNIILVGNTYATLQALT